MNVIGAAVLAKAVLENKKRLAAAEREEAARQRQADQARGLRAEDPQFKSDFEKLREGISIAGGIVW